MYDGTDGAGGGEGSRGGAHRLAVLGLRRHEQQHYARYHQRQDHKRQRR
jgi:hypothetical protein